MRLCRIGLSLLLQARSVGCLRLRTCLSIAGGLKIVRAAFLIDLFDRYLARVFRGLHRLSGHGNQGLSVDVVHGGIRIGGVHQLNSMLIAGAGILFRSLGLRDPQRIPRLVEFQRKTGA